MLCELKVENLALIESLHLVFDQDEGSGLVVMTGETGAGKSIMLRAIHLLMGGRAQSDWIRNGAQQCVVEALFVVNAKHRDLLQALQESGLGDDSTVILKRVITSGGKSRLYVNGSLATVKMVSMLAANLLSIASQHDHQQLLQPALHLDFLDALGEHWEARGQVSHVFSQWQQKRDELTQLRQQERDKEQRRDFLQYQLEEIRQIGPVPGEDEELAAERKRLKNADTLIMLSQKSYRFLSSTLVDGMFEVRRDMEQMVQLDPEAEGLAAELTAYSYQAEDLVSQLRSYKDALVHNPSRLEQVNERINNLQHLKRKYGETLQTVLEYAASAEDELLLIDNMDKNMSELEAVVTALEEETLRQVAVLSDGRRLTAEQLTMSMAAELDSLAFNRSGFEVRFQEQELGMEMVRSNGWDRVEFFFSANPGEPARPLAKVASGGELSRLMLALKCLLARKDMVETVIFDEVDAGIGGEAAEAVARKIQELATHHQVFCVTHLPQIAARGSAHFRVAKQMEQGRTLSSFSLLTPEQRVDELARMLAGDSVSDQTRAWALELLAKGGQGVQGQKEKEQQEKENQCPR
ncbi:MAG: DNA repair protein RecN [Proteobacteria bacterium]|nr:DNA repair protein RecN [Desulfocapsa sp.]MBU3943290.1 DNA repair protein RecN [Pseudomonadota bacterium]MCG2744435.1 DNA repair protein RecN [Desulfobacteraceae bacterium]MBU3982268.1 DNA repair protein RecN [Pseudomonadota bacterium]MBU4028447.1 DNA repair protein RecN [Pseudomonadota bacterium]